MGPLESLYEPGFYCNLVSVAMSSWVNDISVRWLPLHKNHGSYGIHVLLGLPELLT